jgi:ATP-binding cassette subfamily B protein
LLQGNFMPDQPNATQKTVRRTLHYFWQEYRRHWKLSVGMFLAVPIYEFLNSYVIPNCMARILGRAGAENLPSDQLWTAFQMDFLIIVGSLAVGSIIFNRLRVYWLWKLETKAQYELSRTSFDALSEQSMSFHGNKFGGSLVSQANKFVNSFEMFNDLLVYSMLPIVLGLVFSSAVLAPVAPVFVGYLSVFVALYTLVSWLGYKKIAPLNEAHSDAFDRQTGQLADSITNILAIKSYGRESHEKRRFAAFNAMTAATDAAAMRVTLRRDAILDVITSSINVLLVVFLIWGRHWFGIGLGTLVLIVTYSSRILGFLWEVNSIFRDLNRIFSDSHQMALIMDSETAVADRAGAPALAAKKGEVAFEAVTFTHLDSKEPIFSGLTLKIKPGQRVGLVGRSGSGKTTLTKLLLRFADVEKGQITIDGQNIAEVSQVSLRHQIAYVPQETVLFHRSIRDNIAYGRPEASEAEIERAARLANAMEFIKELPKGFDTLTGERGVKLSGGQRQRVAIARAILKDAPILVLDEATSALDSESEKLIQDALAKLMKGRTSVVIAHRLSTVAQLDRIIVLKNGRIAEDGSHQELLALGGEYASLWRRQTGGMIDREWE